MILMLQIYDVISNENMHNKRDELELGDNMYWFE